MGGRPPYLLETERDWLLARLCMRCRPNSPSTWWKRRHPAFDAARLVFIDETWTKTNMTRTHG